MVIQMLHFLFGWTLQWYSRKIPHWIIEDIFLLLISHLTVQCLMINFLIMIFSMPYPTQNLRKLMDQVQFILLSISNCFIKLSRLGISTAIFSSCWREGHIQPVPKKGDFSHPSIYHHISLLFWLLKQPQRGMFLNIYQLLTLFLITSMNFSKGVLIVNILLSLLTLSHFDEKFPVAADIS